MRIALTAFTRRGGALARELFRALGEEGHTCSLACPRRLEEALAFPETYERVGDSGRGAVCRLGRPPLCGGQRHRRPGHRPLCQRISCTDPAVVSDGRGGPVLPSRSSPATSGGANDLARRASATLTGRGGGRSPPPPTSTDRFAVDVSGPGSRASAWSGRAGGQGHLGRPPGGAEPWGSPVRFPHSGARCRRAWP